MEEGGSGVVVGEEAQGFERGSSEGGLFGKLGSAEVLGMRLRRRLEG